nr:putative disease resistance RPP13-like protein 1 [Ziziphus jujuba var. spinosa]XP_024931701.2 putative disease resistance RPP13-like protein 1 [Ziziphus jujuba var. spinosa]XP_024931702.2 putative disease resistance RPP13-like protein 1 [Ziziphus jujuba var. spinosa]XP_024931703.2 putative disease resistance RPP13-like protein 1 [Ziziphus jujuba var. spinosa]XP_048333707.1 putative disease resistance RPP13-like protein 1 [Ziziphus jujuba var. spinosa]
MAAVVGEALLSAFLQVLFDRMTSKDVLNFIGRKKLNNGLLKKLKIKLLSAESVLNDAEEKQMKNLAVRKWLVELKEVIDDADDLVDEINVEALRCEIEGGSGSTSHQVLNFITNPFTAFDKQEVESKIEEILNRLEFILQEKDIIGLKEGVLKTPSQTTPSTSLVEESAVFGRDDDKNVILDLLLSDEVDGNKISVIPIVGMGGIGKTTLAQLIYNNDNVKKHFEKKAWVSVSGDFDLFRITKVIFESVTSTNCGITDWNLLQEKLKKELSGKKFFFVLDDVWNEDYMEWDKLKSPFEVGARGCKIIVTTRSEKVANMMGDVWNYRLQIMSEDDCWSLFVKHAFGYKEVGARPDLEEIGRLVVRKCKGIPLAVKALGGLLRSEQNPQEWKKILKNDVWDSSGKEHILPALWLSYYYLPGHLKRCFAYCSIFPKGDELNKQELILLWMGENLLETHKSMTAEEVGEEYFNDLLSRSLFQFDYHSLEHCYFTMHDLVYDLAKCVSGESYFSLHDNVSEVSSKQSTRHLSYLQYKSDYIKNLEDFCDTKTLRTLLFRKLTWPFVEKDLTHLLEQLPSMRYLRVLDVGGGVSMQEGPLMTKLLNSTANLKLLRYLKFDHAGINEIPDSICTLYNLQTLILRERGLTRLPDSIGNLKQLIYLDLGRSSIGKIPDSIGNLKHLRYLDLSHSSIEEIPDTVCNLHELQTMKLYSCYNLKRLPNSITTLINLRHLNISHDENFFRLMFCGTGLREMPPQMCKLKNLQTLPVFVVGKDSGSNIKELGELQHLQGPDLLIKGLENVINEEDASGAKLEDKKHITRLGLLWTGDSDDSQPAREVLDRLQPHTNLKELYIRSYGGTSFPPWVGHHSFFCIRSVRLSDCKNCCWLPALGQLPSLESLFISGFNMLEKIGNEFYSDSDGSASSSSSITKPFKSLKNLKFSDMAEWREWSMVEVEGNREEGCGVFSNLKELRLSNCPKLKGECLPDYLPSLKYLSICASDLAASLSGQQYPSLLELPIWSCQKMKTFPEGRLPFDIQSIEIGYCKELASLSEEGWPSNLKSLKINDCSKLFARSNIMQWNLGMLTSLTSLHIKGIDEVVDTFPEREGQLPTSLTSLRLIQIPNLKSLHGKAFQQLTSLRNFSIEWCKQLECLPEERLPTSISELWIIGCPLLTPRCQREAGEDWPKIHHIPNISIH